jgi:hypothetical protein
MEASIQAGRYLQHRSAIRQTEPGQTEVETNFGGFPPC